MVCTTRELFIETLTAVNVCQKRKKKGRFDFEGIATIFHLRFVLVHFKGKGEKSEQSCQEKTK